jgi:hypothetical protein
MLPRDRERWGMRECQGAWRFGVSLPEYRGLEARREIVHIRDVGRICNLYGWPQTFVGVNGRPRS